jgi:phosphatidylserine/phosphatidylglycerophosphate/cardiolipin synthase-like enzyme
MGSRKKSGFFFGALAILFFVIAGAAFSASSAQQNATAAQNVPHIQPSLGGVDALVVEPRDGTAPVSSMIQNASSSVDLVMYEFEDPKLEALLAARAKAGIAVRVLLNQGYYGAQTSANEAAYGYLETHGVSVHWTPAYFALTHQKTLVVDGSRALIMTFNLSKQYYASDRDFGIVDSDANDVAAIENTFDADWNGQKISAPAGDDLLWSPGSQDALISLINNARTSLDIYNEEMQDTAVVDALAAAGERGVTVNVDMTFASEWASVFQKLAAAGVHVRTFDAKAPLYIHAKVIIADGDEAFVGSENFSSTSLSANRELGILVADPAIIASLSDTFASDWQKATPFVPSGQ